jgi:general stress protein CsbA
MNNVPTRTVLLTIALTAIIIMAIVRGYTEQTILIMFSILALGSAYVANKEPQQSTTTTSSTTVIPIEKKEN